MLPTLPETNSSHLKIDVWKNHFLLGYHLVRCYWIFRKGNNTNSKLPLCHILSPHQALAHPDPKPVENTRRQQHQCEDCCCAGVNWHKDGQITQKLDSLCWFQKLGPAGYQLKKKPTKSWWSTNSRTETQFGWGTMTKRWKMGWKSTISIRV